MAITQGLKMLPLNNKIPSAIAAMMIVGMSFVSAHAFAAGGGKSSATSAIQDKDARKPIDRNEARMKDLHERLQISADQEVKWNYFVQTERDGAKEMGELIQERNLKVASMNAIDDFKSYQKIAESHADHLKKVIPAFKTLYESMSEGQKKIADDVFKSNGARRAAVAAKASAS